MTNCASGRQGAAGAGILTINFSISQTGKIDTKNNGYYAVLFNSSNEAIEVTNHETFSDYIRFDGVNFTWYHRQGNVPSPGYTWVNAGNMNQDGIITSDGNSLLIRIDTTDPTCLFNQFITTNSFTVHAVTTDRSNSLLGRIIDTIGQGPSIDGNALYTIFFSLTGGVLEPLPSGYPSDPIGDYDEKPDLTSFPYDNFDIDSFSINIE